MRRVYSHLIFKAQDAAMFCLVCNFRTLSAIIKDAQSCFRNFRERQIVVLNGSTSESNCPLQILSIVAVCRESVRCVQMILLF